MPETAFTEILPAHVSTALSELTEACSKFPPFNSRLVTVMTWVVPVVLPSIRPPASMLNESPANVREAASAGVRKV